MDILFRDDELKSLCNDDRVAKRKIGQAGAKKLRRRLDDIAMADSLSDLRTLPGRCHELHKDLAGWLALDLDGARRLLFSPAHTPRPTTPEGKLDWARVTAIRIERIEDYHD